MLPGLLAFLAIGGLISSIVLPAKAALPVAAALLGVIALVALVHWGRILFKD